MSSHLATGLLAATMARLIALRCRGWRVQRT